jgi:hypothetical protein
MLRRCYTCVVSDGILNRDLDSYLESYNSLPFEFYQENFRRNAVLTILESADFSVATEIGCGRSSIFEYWSPSERAQTIEPIQQLLKEASLKILEPTKWSGFNLKAEDAQTRSELIKSDVTILSSILHEVENPARLLREAASLTKTGGLLVIVVTNKFSLHRIIGVELGLQKSLDQKTCTEIKMQQSHGAYSTNQLRIEVENSGLKLLKIETIFPKLFSHRQMQEFLEDSTIDLNFLNCMERLSNFLPGLGSEILAIAEAASD